MQLHEIAQELRSLLEPEELTDESVQKIDQLSLGMDTKVDGLCTSLSELGADEHLLRVELGRLDLRMQRLASKQQRIKEYLKLCLEQGNLTKHKTKIYSVRLQASPPSCELLVEADKLPPEYQKSKTVVTADKAKAVDHWKQTGESPGGFRITVGTHLRVE